MSQQKRHGGVRPDTRDVKSRCEEDRHTREADTHRTHSGGNGAETETKCVEEFNESPVPLNYRRDWSARESVCMWARVCVCV